MLRWQWFDNEADVRDAARSMIAAAATEAIRDRGVFQIVLAGGATPRAVYHTLRELPTRWDAWQVYFGDERVLPAGDPDRNSVMAAQAWLEHVPIPPAQIHVIPTERGLEAAADAYRRLLADVGTFDLVLLGLGEDGHTASLFPGHEWGTGPHAPDVLTVEDAPKPPPQRVSLSAQRLSRARRVVFLVTGAAKREAVARWRRGERIPAAAIQCENGVDVLLDRAANADR